MADIFGDDSLFSEFDRDRDTQNIFIQYDQDESGAENRSRIVFKGTASDSEESDMDESTENGKEPAASSELGEEARVKEEAKSPKEEEGELSSAPQSTAYQENFEKNKLRHFARIIDSTRCVSDVQSPAVQIIFQNNKFAKKYRSRIEQFIVSLAQHADKKDFTKAATDLSSRGTTVSTCVDINDKLPTEKRNTRMWQAHGIIGCAQFHDGFMVDSQGWPHDEEEGMEFGSAEIPKYFQVFEEVFPPADSTDQSLKPPAKPKDSCFNCGGDHRLNECVAPKDHNRIRAKRRERQEARDKSSNPGRYHEDPELDPKRTKFTAGTISESLREAIGLKSDQLPPYIYRMRLYGYPPGWLLEANRKNSSLAMYDRDGRETNLRGESLEDGEYGEQASAAEFDVSKIIEYPGFTVPVPLGFIDEGESRSMPPIQEHQLKKTLVEQTMTRELNKKRQLDEEEKDSRKKMKTDSDTKNQEAKNTTETQKPGEEDGEKQKDDENDDKAEKDTGATTTTSPSTAETPDGETPLANGDTQTPSPPAEETSTPSQSQLFREKNFTFTSSSSLGRSFGTPILVREKSFQQLPSAEKFSVGTEEHIPFENLPNSVGTFEKMRNLFSLIRNKVKKTKK